MFTFCSPNDQVNYTTEGGPEHAALGASRRGSPLGDIVAHPTFILLLLLLPRIEAPTGRDTPPIYVVVYLGLGEISDGL
jgi:hypothetical protein